MRFNKLTFNFVFFCQFLLLFSCNKNANFTQLKQIEAITISIDSTLIADNKIEQMISPYREKLASQMNEVIGNNKAEMYKAQPESSLGNFNVDAILYTARKNSKDTVHAAITNYGGIRIPSINNGDIKLGTMYELMPFDNMLVVIDMNGEQLSQYLTHTIASGGWPVSKEIKIVADTLNEQHLFRINNEPLVNSKQYRVCTSDYLANGGDQCEFLKPLQYEALGVFFRDGLINYVRMKTAKNEQIYSTKEGRFKYVK